MSLKDLIIVSPEQVSNVAARLRESAQQMDNDGTPSQVGMTSDESREIADMLDRLSYEMVSLSRPILQKQLRAERRRANQAERDMKAAWKYVAKHPAPKRAKP